VRNQLTCADRGAARIAAFGSGRRPARGRVHKSLRGASAVTSNDGSRRDKKHDRTLAVAEETPATGGILIGGRYRVGKLIRSGGMGAVYQGEHTQTGRRVAIKLVRAEWLMVDEVERRFEREARIASSIQSKHIVQVFDAGRDEVFGPFIAMELLVGEDLEQRLVRSGALPIRTACEVAFQVARGLERAHAANIAHRDLKPGNIFLASSDEEGLLAKVLDFGIAKRLGALAPESARLTHGGAALGTPQYMSPEQGRGQIDLDTRTDVYSLGAVLYEMIVGQPHVPELPNYDQLVIRLATERAPRISASVPTVDPRIDQLVADMLVGDRRDRLQTMRMARERLGEILGHAPRLGPGGDGSASSGSLSAGRVVPMHARPLRIAARFSTLAETKIKVWRLSSHAAATEVIGFDSDRNVRAHLEITRELRGEKETLLVVFHSPEEGALRMHLDGTPIGEIAGVVDRALCRGIVRDLV
jgi:tRNA A-37 threonylcarbamoyl transferase component Bud32